MHCGARADRTEAQAQMPRSGQYLGEIGRAHV